MEKNTNKNSEISIFQDDNSFNNEKEKLILPIIGKELIPNQNKVQINELFKNGKNKLNNPTFLTLRTLEEEKINLYKSNNIIYKLLKEKIEINPTNESFHNFQENQKLRSNNKLNIYINEPSLLKDSHSKYEEKKELKKIKVGKVFKLSNSFNDNDDDNIKLNKKKTIDLRINNNIYENNYYPRRLISLDKKYNKNLDYAKSNWKQKLNCALIYRYNKNKESIDEVTSKINNMDNKVKAYFDGFKNETDIIFDEVLGIKDNKKKNNQF